jgi:hypothetical protein
MGLSEKYSLQKQPTNTNEELKQGISGSVTSFSEETLDAVVRNFRRRLQMVLILKLCLGDRQ